MLKRRRVVRTSLAAIVMAGTLAAPGSAQANLIFADTFENSPKGLFTCIAFEANLAHGYCIIAYTNAATGTTRVVAEEREGLTRIRVVDTTITGGLSVTFSPRLSVALDGYVDGVGEVHVSAITDMHGGKVGTNNGCVGHPFHDELVSSSDALFAVLRSTGSVASQPVRGGSPCDSFFIDNSSGAWRMALGA